MALCPACNTEVLPGLRWCGICRGNVLQPGVGRLASPGKRLGAFVIDMILGFATYLVVFVIIGAGVSSGSDEGAGAGVMVGLGFFSAAVVVFLVFLGFGTSPGKRLLGMRVVKEDGRTARFWRMLGRDLVRCVLLLPATLFLGYLWILWDRDKQGWHDKLFSTFVVDRRSTATLPQRASAQAQAAG